MNQNSPGDANTPRSSRAEASLVDADGFLKRSLSREEQGRRKKQRWLMISGCLLLGVGALVIASFASSRLFASDKSAAGWALWNQRRLPEAEAKFREALMENDKDANAWTGLGWSLTNTGRLPEALDAFKKALAITPDNASAQNGLGQCALGTGDLALAEEYLKKSGDSMVKAMGGEDKLTAENLPAAWYGLINVYLLKDDFDQAKQWADRIAKISPNEPTLKDMLKQIDKRDSESTKRMFGINANKPSAGASRAQAWQLWNSGQADKAVPLFRELIKQDPNDANALNGLGWSLFNTGNAKEAHEAFLACLKADPTQLAALNGVGQTAIALHDWAKAEEYLQKGSDAFLKEAPADKLSPENLPAAWFGLVRVHLVQGHFEQAIQWSERILKHDPNNRDVKQLLENARKKDNTEIKKLLGVD